MLCSRSSLGEVLNVDVFVESDDDSAISEVSRLIYDIPNFLHLKVGPLARAQSMIQLFLNAATLDGLDGPLIRIVPWIPTSYGASR
jgi:predicted dinucleotide-binding enzyme